MRITLYVTSVSRQGQRIVLRSGQIAQFGRTDWADYSFPDDSQMADVHFAIELNARGCWLRSLAKDRETLVNQKRVDTVALQDQDKITAGQTTLRVSFNEMSAGAPTDAAVAATAAVVAATPQRDLVAECEAIEIAGPALDLASKVQDPNELLSRMIAAGELRSAIRWKTHLLSKREAIWWGTLIVSRTFSKLTEPEQSALAIASKWVREPSEALRRDAEATALKLNYAGPAAMLAAAVFWNDGSLAPAELPVVPPDPRLTGKAITTALLVCSQSGPQAEVRTRQLQYLQLAEELKLPDAS